MTKGNFINIPRGFFHYHVRGDSGNPVYFCHGNSLSAGTYLPFLENLADRGLKMYAPDLRGHGYSTREKPHPVSDWDIFIKDLEQLVRAVTHPPVIGMGHSIGGYFIYAAAALYPDLFSKIILLDPIIFPPALVVMAALVRKVGLAGRLPLPRKARAKKSVFGSGQEALSHYTGKGMFKNWRPDYLAAYVETSLEQDSADTWSLCCDPEFEAQIYEGIPLNTWSHAGQITIPVLVVGGGVSHLFYRSAGIRLQKKIRACSFVELAHLGHFMMMEDPDKVIQTLEPFLEF